MAETQHATTGAEYFSLADVGQYEEEVIEGYRGDLDANAMLPPLPHDVYSTRVSYAEYWPAKEGNEPEPLAADPARRWRKQLAKDGVLMYLTWIKVVTVNNSDPANDNRERNEVLTTYPNKRGITGAQALLQGFGIDTVMLNSHQAQMMALDGALAGEGSMAGAEYDWEATVFDKEAVQRDKQGNPLKDPISGEYKKGVELWSLRGMRKFPKDKDGNPRSEIVKDDGFLMKGPDGNMIPVTEANARNFIRRWVPIGKLTKLSDQLEQSVQNVQAQKAVKAVLSEGLGTMPTNQRDLRPIPPAPPASVPPAQQQQAQAPRPALPGRPAVRRVTG